MATTTNYGWETPDDTDLVKDGALAMRTLGNSIDTSLAELRGGTTGQVLSKSSNAQMDFTWVTPDDANAIQNAIVDAKGDLITATAADTPARLAVGSNGDTLVADSAATTGLRWQGNYAAGKNKIINGDFTIRQRGYTSTTSNSDFVLDRFRLGRGAGGTVTYSAQTFTPGTAPVAGYEATNFARLVTVSQSANADYAAICQPIEDVRTLAGQTVTVSVWAKGANNGDKFNFTFEQVFGTGGSSAVISKGAVQTVTTSWARYSVTFTLGSMSGKTIGTNSTLLTWLFTSGGSSLASYTDIGNQNTTIDFWGLQVEAGSVATAFQTATGTLQGETALCYRYLPVTYVSAGTTVIIGQATGSGTAYYTVPFMTEARTQPTGITVTTGTLKAGTSTFGDGGGTGVFNSAQLSQGQIIVTGASGLTAGNASYIYPSATAKILWTGCEL